MTASDQQPGAADASPSAATPTNGAEDELAVELTGSERAAAEALFGAQLPLAEQYAWLLATDGVLRGLIGPREAPRLWQRHLLNCAAVAERVPGGATVLDVGTGAGLPGLVLAVARPDLTVTLVDSMARRTAFLTEVVGALDLGSRVRVVRARAEECVGELPLADVVLSRAVAQLDQLAAWCLPLTAVGGVVVAMKGDSAESELETHREAVRGHGGGPPAIHRCGEGLLTQPATVVEFVRERVVTTVPSGPRRGRAESATQARVKGGEGRGRGAARRRPLR
ncbi:16S rRNA (guanine(527)-N(7))-methyltransferase RsmG [Natronosporangium hydrolyticum]|uniref:Ribosomal RNA small subunit methyltransferase G n=1 Tax=Natronosporangium hydrolyticum TaxID=2811111 RepID=A0A895YHG4_9ACTN|nr:16S rRNA (guanine(527)-N(7))-methyltransferase RsmG [Natronosporangium hydrolyticum]QSB14823.1 16S rRNA (guanine(527)-N(7))-methyltransferase RsmG [Natronosporangium hydrolyticum]